MDPLKTPRPIHPATAPRLTCQSCQAISLEAPRLRRWLLTVLLLLTGCGNEPDLLAFGARELPGTLDADYLTARPFSIAPDASMLVYATPLSPAQRDGDPLAFDLGRLASFRILDLASGSQVKLPELPPEQHEILAFYGLLHEAPCWLEDSRTLLFRTSSRGYLQFGPFYSDPAWRLVREAPSGLAANCNERAPPIVNSLPIGQFRVERTGVEVLRVRHASTADVLFEVEPEGLNTQVNVSGVSLAPGGDRLALVYSQGVGSFTGSGHATVISARDNEAAVRPLGSGVLVVDWLDERSLVGYARPNGRRAHALFTWTLD